MILKFLRDKWKVLLIGSLGMGAIATAACVYYPAIIIACATVIAAPPIVAYLTIMGAAMLTWIGIVSIGAIIGAVGRALFNLFFRVSNTWKALIMGSLGTGLIAAAACMLYPSIIITCATAIAAPPIVAYLMIMSAAILTWVGIVSIGALGRALFNRCCRAGRDNNIVDPAIHPIIDPADVLHVPGEGNVIPTAPHAAPEAMPPSATAATAMPASPAVPAASSQIELNTTTGTALAILNAINTPAVIAVPLTMHPAPPVTQTTAHAPDATTVPSSIPTALPIAASMPQGNTHERQSRSTTSGSSSTVGSGTHNADNPLQPAPPSVSSSRPSNAGQRSRFLASIRREASVAPALQPVAPHSVSSRPTDPSHAARQSQMRPRIFTPPPQGTHVPVRDPSTATNRNRRNSLPTPAPWCI